MGFLSLLQVNPMLFAALAGLLLYSIIAHEMAHGYVALFFGDDTAKRYGRLTLNPFPHIDPIGLIMLFVVGFGWAKPVPVDYGRLKNSRTALVSVSLAGPLTNIFIAAIAVFILQFQGAHLPPAATSLLSVLVRINIILGAFNLIPIPPLDGSKVLMSFLSEEGRRGFARIERYGFFLLAILLVTGMLNPVIRFMEKAVYGSIMAATALFH